MTNVIAVQRVQLRATSDGAAIMPRDRISAPGGRLRIEISPAVQYIGFTALESLKEIVAPAAQVIVEGSYNNRTIVEWVREQLAGDVAA